MVDEKDFLQRLKKKYPKGCNEMGMEINTFVDTVETEINNQPQVHPIVRTQADRIRNMSDEELAELIDKVEFCKGKVLEECEPEECNDCAGCCSNTLAWLQSEVKEV